MCFSRVLLNSVLVPADQIQQREQENPHHIDQVPVQAAQFNRRVIAWAKLSTMRTQEQPGQEAQANERVEGVQAGHSEIEREEDFCELRSWHSMNLRDIW